jgi:hypothetical protein
MKSELFTAFGLTIESQIPLPELPPAGVGAQAQVKICLGQVPKTLPDSLIKNPWYEVSRNAYLLRVEGIAEYYVQNGETVTIAPAGETPPEDIRIFLLTSVMAQLLHQRHMFVLHGSAVMFQGKAVLFLGPAMAGKTSLALQLYQQGYPFLIDELSVAVMENGKMMLLPGIARLAVWQDTLEKAGHDPAAFTAIRRGISKYHFPVAGNETSKKVEISDVILMNFGNTRNMTLNGVTGTEKFKKIMLSTYHLESRMCGFPREQNYLHAVGLASGAKVYRLEYNLRLHASGALAAFVAKELTARGEHRVPGFLS